jgi:mannonate dehydratase
VIQKGVAMSVILQNIRTISTAPEGINLTAVKVETNMPGLYGVGCSTFAYRYRAVEHLIEHYLKPLIIGREVSNIEQLWHLMYQNAYWRGGPIENSAIGGIDMALWDIKGKLAGMPVYQLWGGKCREGALVYRHANGADFEELCDSVERFRSQGVRNLRCQLGGYGGGSFDDAPPTAPEGSPKGVYLDSGSYMRATLKMFEKLRMRFGGELGLCHDVHERLSPSDAVVFTKELEPFKLVFLEDPVPLEQHEWLRRIRNSTTTPIAQGELFTSPDQWHGLIAEKLIDFARPHVSQIGGVTQARKLQLFAEQYGVRTAWHGPGDMSPIGHAANVHLDIASSNFGIQEWSGTEPPNKVIQDIREQHGALLEVFPGALECRDGYVYPRESPGWGVDIDEREAAKYPCDDRVTLWTQTRREDGALQVP